MGLTTMISRSTLWIVAMRHGNAAYEETGQHVAEEYGHHPKGPNKGIVFWRMHLWIG